MERMNLDDNVFLDGLPSFDDCSDSGRSYGGMAGVKRGVLIDGEAYMIKYPDNLRAKQIKNADTSYGNNPIAEHLGSRIYEAFGIPVHKTLLGVRNGKLVVACKDFTFPTTKLTEMREIMVSSAEEFIDEIDPSALATTRELGDYIKCLREWNTPFPSLSQDLEKRLWITLVVDALIGNPDRNNGNWGVCTDKVTGLSTLAPVYDNGNSLNFRLSERQITDILLDDVAFNRLATGDVRSWFTLGGHTINIFKLLKNKQEYKDELIGAIRYVVSHGSSDVFCSLVDRVEVLSTVKKDFYVKLLGARFAFLTQCL